MRSAILSFTILAVAPLAHADAVDAPLLLPARAAAAGVSFEITSLGGSDLSGTGEAVVASFDYGASDRLQLGLNASAAIDPSAFGSIDFTGQLALSSFAAARLDAGLSRGTFIFGTRDGANLYEISLGLPAKLRLADGVALTTGRTTAAGFGRPMAYSVGNASVVLGANPFYGGDAIVAVGVDESGNVSTMIQAPVGLLIAPLDNVSLALRAGFRHVAPADGDGWNAVPAGVDLVVRAGAFDIGATFEVLGMIHSGVGYLDQRQLAIWAGARI